MNVNSFFDPFFFFAFSFTWMIRLHFRKDNNSTKNTYFSFADSSLFFFFLIGYSFCLYD